MCFEDHNINILRRFQPHLQITFDGFDSTTHDITRGKGNFNCIVNGIKNSRKKGFLSSIGVRINIHNDNFIIIDSILKMLVENFEEDESLISTVYVAIVHENGSYARNKILGRDHYQELAQKIDDWNKIQIQKESFTATYEFLNPDIGCPYNEENGSIDCGIKIDCKGHVYPCQLFSDSSFSLGNIRDSSLQDIISSNEMDCFIEKISKRKNNEQCLKCAYQIFCGRGCPAKSFIETKNIFSEQYCFERKKTFNSILKKVFAANDDL